LLTLGEGTVIKMTRAEIDRAIEWIDQEKKRTEDYLNDPDMPKRQGDNVGRIIAFSENKVAQLSAALTALREALERVEGCWACANNCTDLTCRYYQQVTEDDIEEFDITPKFCPVCGRRLKEGVQDDQSRD